VSNRVLHGCSDHAAHFVRPAYFARPVRLVLIAVLVLCCLFFSGHRWLGKGSRYPSEEGLYHWIPQRPERKMRQARINECIGAERKQFNVYMAVSGLQFVESYCMPQRDMKNLMRHESALFFQ